MKKLQDNNLTTSVNGIVRINRCKINMKVKAIDHDFDYEYISNDVDNAQIKLIIFNQFDNIKDIENIFHCIINKNGSISDCILVENVVHKKMNNLKNKDNGSVLANQWNIPYFIVNPKHEKSINNLFKFSIKYYWFQQLMN